MLTDGDRVLLSPLLNQIHAARAALAGSRQAAADAQRRVTELKRSSSLWDRVFNRDGEVGRAFRDARKAHADAKATVAEWRKRAKALESSLASLIKPMMPRLDRRYEAVTVATDRCARAVRECRAMRAPIDALVATADAAIKTSRDDKTRRDAEAAVFGYRDHLAQARKAVRAVEIAVGAANSAVIKAGIGGQRPQWNDMALERLPATADNLKDLRRLTNEIHRLRGLPSRLDRVRADLTRLQARAGREQKEALSRARERLIKGSAPPAGAS